MRHATTKSTREVGFRTFEVLRRPAPAAVSYVVVFGVLAAPLLPHFGEGIPQGPNHHDEELIVWILSWVSHALGSDPFSLFHANINHPAPAQLTSSDHFFSSQILFAPTYAASGNPLLAANLTALATYPLAAWGMQRLVLRLGGQTSVAWVAGLVFALGPRRTPFNVHILQYANLFLPLVALCLTRLREQPDLRRAAVLAFAFGVGVLSSFYMALLLGLVAIVWGLFEVARPGPRRVAYVVAALAAATVAIAASLLAIAPYFDRLGGIGQDLQATSFEAGAVLAAARGQIPGATPYPLALFVLAGLVVTIAGAMRGVGVARRALGPAATLVALGLILMPGVPESLARLLEATPVRFFNYTARFQLLVHFGGVLLLAAALETIGTEMHARARSALALVLLAFVVYDRGIALSREPLRPAPAFSDYAEVYESVRDIALERGRGPILEMPARGRLPRDKRIVGFDTDAMLGSTLHWLPLVTGYTGHHPEHRPLLLATIGALPTKGVLEDLVNLTGLRWLLIRPPEFWESEKRYRTVVSGLVRSPLQVGIWPLGQWILLEIATPQSAPRWREAVTLGTSADETILGTPWQRLADDDAVGRVKLMRARNEVLAAGQSYSIALSVENIGNAAWPVVVRPHKVLRLSGAVPSQPFRSLAVTLVARWVPRSGARAGLPVREERAALRRDIPAGDTLRQKIMLLAPEEPGRYQLEIGLDQIEGAPFTGPGNERILLDVDVEKGTVARNETPIQSPSR